MNISKRKQGILAIICTIAMIVTSITVYNPREVKADADYSKLTYNYKNDYKKNGEAYMKGSETTKSPWKVAIDESQSKGDIVEWMTTGAGNLNFYNDMFMNVTWYGNYPDATVEINSVKVEKEGKGVQVFNSAEIHVNAKEWINNNAYNVVKVTSKDGSQYVTFIVATGDKAVTSSEETTTRDPSAVVWKDIANGPGYSYNDNTTVKVENVQKADFASEQGIYMTVPNTIESVTINGVDSQKYALSGAGVVVYLSGLVKGENTINIKYVGGEATVIIKNENEVVTPNPEETTTAAYKDGEVLVNESNQTKEVPACKDKKNEYEPEYKHERVKYVQGKKYVAEVIVSSTAAKEIGFTFQKNGGDWDFVDADNVHYVGIAAGNKVKITYVFESKMSVDDGIFDIYLGCDGDATTLVFESKKLTTYNEVPAGVQTGVEVLEAPETPKYKVSIDGEEKQCKEGDLISVPTEGQGYYDVTKKVAYAPGKVLLVKEDMTLKSIKLNVTMTPGASIRLAAPTGLRFQTTVKSGNGIAADEILNSSTVTTGTLITTLDLYKANGKTLTKDSKYNFLDIANNGWFNDGAKTETGKFCGSIIKIQSKNYGRAYIAVGYATINYSNGKSKTVCADVTENNAKSIAYVAGKVKDSEKFSSYSSEQQDIIMNYINGKEISK